MGPSTLIDGDAISGEVRAWALELQWGRRLSSTETPNSLTAIVPRYSLQWGRRLSSTETSDGPDKRWR